MTTFADSGLNPLVLTALQELGFENLTPIQEKSIPHLLVSKRDLIAMAQTGTGKTAAFSLPVINQIDVNSKKIQALILCPTRELCLQIKRDIETFIKYMKGISVVAVYGGESVMRQIRDLQQGTQIVVGTPGRVQDFVERKKLNLDNVDFLVLDEADEMLKMGFKEELDAILAKTPQTKQTLLFSATMPSAIANIAKKYMKNPEQIQSEGAHLGSENVSHRYYVAHARDRYEVLRRIADSNPQIYGIVFCRTRRETQEVADQLIQDNYSVEALHGDISQEQREQVMDRFRKKQTQLLVATDVAARGIDVSELTHVINYQLPENAEAYIHRSGRTGRAHSMGLSIVIIHMKEHYRIKDIERKIGKRFEQGVIPGGKEICETQLFTLIDKVKQVAVNEGQIGPFLAAIESKLTELTREELIKRFVSMEFNRFLDLYKNAPDLNVQGGGYDRGGRSSGGGRSGGFGGRGGGGGGTGITFSTFAMNLGRQDGFTKKDLFGIINRAQGLRGVEIGNIDVGVSGTVFELDSACAPVVARAFEGLKVHGKPVFVKSARGGGLQSGGGFQSSGGGSGSGGGRPQYGGGRSQSGGGHRSSGGGRPGSYKKHESLGGGERKSSGEYGYVGRKRNKDSGGSKKGSGSKR